MLDLQNLLQQAHDCKCWQAHGHDTATTVVKSLSLLASLSPCRSGPGSVAGSVHLQIKSLKFQLPKALLLCWTRCLHQTCTTWTGQRPALPTNFAGKGACLDEAPVSRMMTAAGSNCLSNPAGASETQQVRGGSSGDINCTVPESCAAAGRERDSAG